MQVLLVVHIIIVVSLIGIILIQRSSADGFTGGGGSGGMDSLLSGRASGNLLTRATAILATLFLLNSLLLAYLSTSDKDAPTLADQLEQTAEELAPTVPLDDDVLSTESQTEPSLKIPAEDIPTPIVPQGD